MDLMKAMQVSASGIKAQGARMKVITENIANADSIIGENGQEPYRRQMVFLGAVEDTKSGTAQVQLTQIRDDFTTPFKREFDPNHPLADENGFIRKPNINTIEESTDLREAARSYEANLSAIESSKRMMQRTMDILR